MNSDSEDWEDEEEEEEESEEEPEDPKDGDYIVGGPKRTGTASKKIRNAIYKNNSKAKPIGRRGSFEVPCSICNKPVHVHHDGYEKGVEQMRGRGAKRKLTKLQPPICHGEDNAAVLLGALDDIAEEIRRSSAPSKKIKAMFSDGTDEFKEIRREIEWGDNGNLGPGHTKCNSRHLGGDPSYKSLSDTRKQKLKSKVRQKIADKAVEAKKKNARNFWMQMNDDGSVWGPSHPLGRRPGGGGGAGGAGGTTV